MLELYWGFLITGVLFALVSVLFGDLLSSSLGGVFDFLSGDVLEKLQPMVLFSSITVFGGAGIVLTEYTAWASWVVMLLSVLISVTGAVLIYFLYVKPMNQSENSVAFSLQDLVGRIAEVSVPVPAAGYGEVMVRIGAGITNQIAASFDGVMIEAGARVVVIEAKDHTLYVSRWEEE